MVSKIRLAEAKRYTFELLRPLTARHTWVFWGYLLVIAAAELISVVVSPPASMLVYVVCLMALILHASFGSDRAGRELALALSLVPLIRLLSWFFPLGKFPPLTWYPILGALLLIASWFVVRQLKLTRRELGLRPGNLLIQLMLAGFGPILGVLASAWLNPAPLLTGFSWITFVLSAVVLILFTGFLEEFLFRGVIQAATLRAFRHAGGLLYASMVCAALYLGYRSVGYVLFVLTVSLVFAYIVCQTGSILGTSLAHGLMNVVVLLIIPYLALNPNEDLRAVLQTVSWVGLIMALVALLSIVLRNQVGEVAVRVKRVFLERIGAIDASRYSDIDPT